MCFTGVFPPLLVTVETNSHITIDVPLAGTNPVL